METDFPKMQQSFLKASMFQDTELTLTYKGWEKKANEDTKTKEGMPVSWKSKVKYCLRYSYPEFAVDEVGDKRLDKEGNPFRNRNFDPKCPHGYTVLIHFEEGRLETGSLPLFNALCLIQPKKGDLLMIGKTGEMKDTKWTVKKCKPGEVQAKDDSPSIDVDGFTEDELSPDEEVPF